MVGLYKVMSVLKQKNRSMSRIISLINTVRILVRQKNSQKIQPSSGIQSVRKYLFKEITKNNTKNEFNILNISWKSS